MTREQSRAAYPDETGYIGRPGARARYEVYGNGSPTILFAPTWSIVHSRIWKAQIPYFARRNRVIALDPRGNGGSDRPIEVEAYDEWAFADDLIAVLDATGTDRAVVVALSIGAQRALIAATDHPERISGLVIINPSVALGSGPGDRTIRFEEELDTDEGWNRYNRHSWRRDYAGFAEFFFGRCFTEPHSTKQIEDAVAWALETDAEVLIRTHDAGALDAASTRERAQGMRCATLVIQGEADAITGVDRGVQLAAAIPDARLELIAGGGHIPNARDPVRVNLLIRDFVERLPR